MDKILLLMAGGSAGTLLRYGLALLCKQWWGEGFAAGTLAANLLGCLLIGMLFALTEAKPTLSPQLQLLLVTGFLGALTTFSTFQLDVFQLLRQGETAKLLLYAGGNLLAGYALLWLGYEAVRWATRT